ncbi:putative HNHc nuclease [Beduinella massiliensis]|uniref:putative HNHc nuclease n=1 Tax=Beduinella massiliensis TaxID=1852363 RepID=UPI000C8568A3
MEVVDGKIVNATPEGITIFVPYTNVERLCLRRYDAVQVGLPDGRRISPEQRRKAYALLGEIAEWAGYEVEEIKLVQKREFVHRHLQALEKELFSLSNCDMTTAREFVAYLIDFVLEFDVPTHVPLVTLCDDIQRYVYACLVHKKCAVCGKRAELHHVDRVGMGNDRTQIEHIGRRALPLCRIHHIEVDHRGDAAFMARYHLEPVQIDEKISKIYKLRTKRSKP